MKPPGVLINGRAGSVRRDPALVDRIRRLLPSECVRLTRDPAEVPGALSALYEAGVDTLVIVGGDGSATGTLTPLLESWPREELPALLLAGGGTVNTIARSLGARGRAERVVTRLLRAGPTSVSHRPVLRLQVEGERTGYAMIFVCGVPVRFLEHYYRSTRRGPAGAFHALLSCTASILADGPLAHELFRPMSVQIRVDGERRELQHATILAASTVQDVGLGFRPFRSAGCFPDRFHWLATEMRGRELARLIPALRLGLPRALAHFDHAATAAVELSCAEPLAYSIDADLFPARRKLRIEAGPTLRFLSV
ncbi:MAG: diacylglycerol/lipid kinase family protein [Myxococcota bacterium]